VQVNLDAPLPPTLAVGAGTALFVCGACFDREAEIRSLSFLANGQEQPVWAHGMPRLDYFRSLHWAIDPYEAGALQRDPASPLDPLLHSYASGFWGLVRVERTPRADRLELQLLARSDTAPPEVASLETISLSSSSSSPASSQEMRRAESLLEAGAGAPVAICLASYEPPLDLLRRQIDSIRSQTHANWICLISDDCSAPERFRAIERLVEGDARFLLSRSPARQGFYLNFERALEMVPRAAAYVALSDQDDFWYPDKIETLLGELGPAQLVYSDARIVSPESSELAPTYWGARRNNHRDLLSLLLANCVTGAASLMRREVLDYALPFPPAQFAHFHDHWLALNALVLGGIEFVDRPLYDYVQHRQAALGHAKATHVVAFGQRLGRWRGDPRERVRVYRTRYFVDVMRLMAFASILQMRCGPRMSQRHRHELDEFLALECSLPAMARLSWRAGRELAGAPETLGAEWAILQSLIWRRALSRTASSRPRRRMRLDAVPPPNLAPAVGARQPPTAEGPRLLAEKVAPIDLAVSDKAPVRVNLLIPTIDLEHFFGGYIAKFNLARRMAERGARVRIVTVDPVGALPGDWTHRVEAYAGLRGLFQGVEVAFGRGGPLELSRSDAFVATTWWTAHIAHAALAQLGRAGFAYLIQEYEPMTFPMGSYSALAEQSYCFPHFALFSSRLLQDYFSRHSIGVFQPGRSGGEEVSAAFENAITAVAPPGPQELHQRSSRRVLFYARPEPHAARNMFELAILALHEVAEEGLFRAGWELHGIGGLGGRRQIGLADGVDLELLPRTGQGDYAQRLRDHDVGLALMYTPHPSLVPIEMASAGLLTVTNSFENKTAEALKAISGNLIAYEPTVEGVARGLREAVAEVGDVERRRRGAEVSWSRDWNTSFDDELLGRLGAYLALDGTRLSIPTAG
jgi:glycosyltransferase involved in cell wall biosynthesis